MELKALWASFEIELNLKSFLKLEPTVFILLLLAITTEMITKTTSTTSQFL